MNGYNQLIKSYTREDIVNNNVIKACLDHIYVRSQDFSSEGIIIRSKITDHYIIGAKIITDTTGIISINENILYEKIEKFDWKNLLNCTDTDIIYLQLNQNLNQLYSESTFVKINNRRSNNSEWLKDELVKLMHERDLAFKKFKNCPSNTTYRQIYIKLRNRTTKEIRKAKNNIFTKHFKM
ncbi:hypothetical protein J437_LFUL013990 [Ladona fulva]|uniref:Uncharacterized protein n=1 Tax=Ladona fulva TaxID=123851 RepID=A0A8K0KEP1_LADFU|nr:hypothetical protein J437_LFUL013990 [Ladona fulva]